MAKAYANVSICVRPPRGPRDPTHDSQHPANSAERGKINVENRGLFLFFLFFLWIGAETDLIRRPNYSETGSLFLPPRPRGSPDPDLTEQNGPKLGIELRTPSLGRHVTLT